MFKNLRNSNWPPASVGPDVVSAMRNVAMSEAQRAQLERRSNDARLAQALSNHRDAFGRLQTARRA